MPSPCLVKETVIRQSLPVRQALTIFIRVIRIIYNPFTHFVCDRDSNARFTASDYVGPRQVDCPTGFLDNETGTLFLAFFSSVMTKPSTLLLRCSVIGIKF